MWEREGETARGRERGKEEDGGKENERERILKGHCLNDVTQTITLTGLRLGSYHIPGTVLSAIQGPPHLKIFTLILSPHFKLRHGEIK